MPLLPTSCFHFCLWHFKTRSSHFLCPTTDGAFLLGLHLKEKSKNWADLYFRLLAADTPSSHCSFFLDNMFHCCIRSSKPFHLWSRVIRTKNWLFCCFDVQTLYFNSIFIILLICESDRNCPTLVFQPFDTWQSTSGTAGCLLPRHGSDYSEIHSIGAELTGSGISTLCLRLIICRVSFHFGFPSHWCWAFHFHITKSECAFFFF